MCNDLRFPKFLLETSVALQMWMRRSTKRKYSEGDVKGTRKEWTGTSS